MQRYTKAQIQMGETIAVLIVFIVLFMFGLYWYIEAQAGGAVDAEREQLRLELLEVTKQAITMSEIQCSVAGASDITCIDIYRLDALNQQIQGTGDPRSEEYQEYYFDFFLSTSASGYRLNITKLGEPHGWVLFDEFEDEIPSMISYIPVILQDPITGTKEMGMMEVQQFT